MRNLIVSVATSAILASSALADCSGVDSLFPMDEITSNQVFDVNGTGANVNGTLEIANGKVKGAVKFDGKSYLSVSDSNFSNFSSDFSMVAFIKTDAKAMMQSIIDKREGNKGYHLFLNSPATSEATLAVGINGINFGNPNTKALNDNKWHCVAVSVDRNSNNIGTLYIDGSAVHTFDTSSITGDTSTNSNLLIGATTPNQMFSSNFEGNLDEVAFASTALKEEDIKCLCSRSEMLEDENDLPLIPLIEENSVTINHQFEQTNPALPAVLELNTTSSTLNVTKNTLIPLTITTVNVKDVNLSASDKSVYFKQDGDIVYVSFSRSGEYNITLQGVDNSNNYLSSTLTFTTVANSAPIASNGDFNINSNEVLKFDGNTYFKDLDGDFLTYTLEGANPKGTLQINDNLIIFTPDKESYATSFSLKATDPDGATSIATFNVNVTFASEIELLRGWNLIGNSIESKAINTSAILETDEIIYTLADSGFWEMSDLNYNSKYVKPKEGVWIKVVDDRKLTINQTANALIDSTSKTVTNGWNLLADTKEKPLRELKYGYDQIFVYDKKNNTWLNSTTNPNYILPTFKGFWGRAINVAYANQAPDITQLNYNIPNPYEVQVNTSFDINFSNFVDPEGDAVILSIENTSPLTFSKTADISDGESVSVTTPANEGSYTFSVKLTDENNLSSSLKDFTINVVPIPNNAPVAENLNVVINSKYSGVDLNDSLGNISKLEFFNDENITFNFSDILGTDVDVANGDSVTLSIDNSAYNLNLTATDLSNIAENDAVTLTTPSTIGDYSFDVIVTDSLGASTSKTVDFNISTPNIPFSRQIAFYSFDSRNAVSEINSPTYDGNATDVNYTSGQIGQGGSFNGNDSKIVTPSFSTTEFSLSFWVEGGFSINFGECIFSLGSNTNYYQINLWQASQSYLTLTVGNGSAWVDSNKISLSENRFYHFVVTYKNNLFSIYIDNNYFGEISQSMPVSSGSLKLGVHYSESSFYWEGKMDQVRFFDKALTPEEVQSLYNLEK